ncbi:MAG: bifunctional proline dehydrogenase/L-glutamate gamma-semialdehyde dehydrogenase PutA [Alphaproteobacteria bacterium]|nr:bifunctional proline dehydrogenase/L-glutamate gamma-semialdehyde dehydrogenase PutA [Alphaproteobacteria bacterium]
MKNILTTLTTPSPFAAPYARRDEDLFMRFAALRPNAITECTIAEKARMLVRAMREAHKPLGGVEDFLHEFSLSSREGLAIMSLAESLLRVPDDGTADQLIIDKLSAGDFSHHMSSSNLPFIQACAFALGLSARLVSLEEAHSLVVDIARRLGLPALREATRQAIRFMAGHFVYGETIGEALSRAQRQRDGERFSFDMLGEGARSAADAERYFETYAAAIRAIGDQPNNRQFPDRQGISVKLSALHPRYEAISHDRVMKELSPRLLELARLARTHDLPFTIDAEEADRLELSLDVFANIVADPSLVGWEGFGLAVQAYQKRAIDVVDHIESLARAYNRRFMLRLVKGAYWDSEIKRAQERGLADYPVFTRKSMTDLNYVACTTKLLSSSRLYPQFATHNPRTVAEILIRARARKDYEFQRLHGMGQSLSEAIIKATNVPIRVYAPVGQHRDLLAYLVRRLMENGANSSFIARAADPLMTEDALIASPYEAIPDAAHVRHPRLPLPSQIYEPFRANSRGVEFGDRTALTSLLKEASTIDDPQIAKPSILVLHTPRNVYSPIDGSILGVVVEAKAQDVAQMMLIAARAFPNWNTTPVQIRARILDRTADLLEARRGVFLSLLQCEAGKTLDDALAELREAIDMCRYYARQAHSVCATTKLPGPTGEDNRLIYDGRGVFVCISPWNFPLAIFLGQVAAALVCGNVVVAKPAEQTPLIAARAIALLHEAGVPDTVAQLAPGTGETGAALVSDEHTSGVAFTGSFEVAQIINRTLAERSGAIVPLIAETGGVNAMIVDSTALIEQVVDDVIASAFRSAGQRCSALRLLCLQEEIAPTVIDRLIGATRELRVGDPRDVSVHIGPVIDAEAKQRIETSLSQAKSAILYAGVAPNIGTFVSPHILSVKRPIDVQKEVFGPVLHVTTWRSDGFANIVEEIISSGYGLTFALETRIDMRVDKIRRRAPAGNIYINRNMIGAVVGSQPFGGFGLSGTGPKAGGPTYLQRFLREITITLNTSSSGGDTHLLSMDEEP